MEERGGGGVGKLDRLEWAMPPAMVGAKLRGMASIE
jgi:hypothetical protein